MGGFRTGLEGCKLLRGRPPCGLLCSKLTPKLQSKPLYVTPPPRPGFTQVSRLGFGSLVQECAQCPQQGTSAAAQTALVIFRLPGSEGVKLFGWKTN